jgi:hypothetical protein
MITETPGGQDTMATPSLSRVAPVTNGPRPAEWEQAPARRQRTRPRRQPGGQAALLRAALPEREPEGCTLACEVDAGGNLIAILILDATSGELLRRLGRGDIERLGESFDPRGLLFERRG